MTTRIENTIPVLAVVDLNRSLAFYRDVLGFDVEWNTGTTCSVARDGCPIMLQVRQPASSGTVWIGVESDSLFERLGRSGVEVVQQPVKQPWAYEMKIADPDGNIIWLGADPDRE